MSPETLLLCGTAATIAFVHTLLGPDHYLPFVAMAKSRGWSMAKTIRITLGCGAGHVVGSMVLGFVGVYAGIQLGSLTWIEGQRGDLAAWGLIAFGLMYMAWGLRRAYRKQEHSHWHAHDGKLHMHTHNHHENHAHAHTAQDSDGKRKPLAAWVIFLIFVLGPCEPLIPILMFPAARESVAGVVAVTSVFALVTMATMLFAVVVSTWGLNFIRMPRLENFGEAIAGGAIMTCGLSIAFLGL